MRDGDPDTIAHANRDRAFEELVAGLASGLIVAEGGDLDGGIETALAEVVRFYGADRSTLFRIATDGPGEATGGDFIATDCWTRPNVSRIEGVIADRDFPKSLARIRAGESVFLDPGRGRPADAAADLATCRSWGIESLVASPLVADGRVVGAVSIGQLSRRRPWSDAERVQLATIAGLFASAVARRRTHLQLATARSRLEEAERRFRRASAAALGAQEEERRRIARDLHDDVTQRLVSLSLELELAGVRESVAAEVRTLAELVHGHSRRLHPRLVESLGLLGAVDAEVAAFESRFAGEVALIAPEDAASGDRVPTSIAGVACLVLKEALRNVERHAGAARVEIRISIRDDGLGLEIEDDGCGFGEQAPPSGLGLISMRERVELVGGRIRFDRGRLDGALVWAMLPSSPNPDPTGEQARRGGEEVVG